MKGPKGMGSFLPFIFVANNITEIIAPNKNDRNMVRNIFFKPKINPSDPIKVTSPQPIAPLETIIMIIINEELKTSPKILFKNPSELL